MCSNVAVRLEVTPERGRIRNGFVTISGAQAARLIDKIAGADRNGSDPDTEEDRSVRSAAATAFRGRIRNKRLEILGERSALAVSDAGYAYCETNPIPAGATCSYAADTLAST